MKKELSEQFNSCIIRGFDNEMYIISGYELLRIIKIWEMETYYEIMTSNIQGEKITVRLKKIKKEN